MGEFLDSFVYEERHWTFWKSNEQVQQLLAELVLPPCFEPSAAGAPFGYVLTNPWFMEAWGRGALRSEHWIASDYYFQSGELAEFQLQQISIPSQHQHQQSCRNGIPETWDGPTCKYFSTQGFELGCISGGTLNINYLCLIDVKQPCNYEVKMETTYATNRMWNLGHGSIWIVNEPLTSFNPWFTVFLKGYILRSELRRTNRW
jgi:hypothetical protein